MDPRWPHIRLQIPIRTVFVADIDGNNGFIARQQIMGLITNNRRLQLIDNRARADAVITGRAEIRETAKEITSSEVSSRIALARSINAVGVAGDESRVTSKMISGAQFSEILLLRLVLPSGATVGPGTIPNPA